jgi:hypothetical protein
VVVRLTEVERWVVAVVIPAALLGRRRGLRPITGAA